MVSVEEKILIYEPSIKGHHTEYLEHLASYLSEQDDSKEYYFLTNPQLKEKFAYIVALTKNKSNVYWISLTESEFEKINKGSRLMRSFQNYFLLKKYAGRLSIKKVLLMYFDIFQLPLCFFRPKFKVSGILFLSFYRLRQDSLKAKVKYFLKYSLTKMLSRNESITNVFMLNDESAAQYFNQKFNTNIFKMLPDPIPNWKAIDGFNIYKEYNIKQHRKIFINVSYEPRKGHLAILDAINYLHPDIQEKICFLFVGGGNYPQYINAIKQRIDFYSLNSKVQIVFEHGRLSNEKLKSVFEQCNCSLMVYNNFVGSSGVLGHSTFALKPVIGYDYGLIGELIKKHNLGKTVNNAQEIAEAISYYAENEIIIHKNDFTIDKTPEYFSNQLISI